MAEISFFRVSAILYNIRINLLPYRIGEQTMSISVGDKLPAVTLYRMGSEGPEAVESSEIFNGKKVVLFAVPGAFTPTCSEAHLPSFVARASDIKAKGVDSIVCIAVNDPFVMGAWGDQHKVGDIMMLSDGNGELTKALGVDLDLSARGLGLRSDRYAMVVDDGVVSHFAREKPRAFEVSSAEAVLQVL